MAPRALVVGGTGPTGIWIVHGLVLRGYEVTILHRGDHERAETPASVAHLHRDPYDPDDLAGALAGRTFDVVVAMYGRLRRIAELTRGATGHFVSVGGVPAHRGWMNPALYDPPGLPVPIGEQGPTVHDPAEDEKGYGWPAPRSRSSSTIPTRCTSATRTRTARTSSCPESGRSCGACSTAGPASSSPTTGSRSTTTATR